MRRPALALVAALLSLAAVACGSGEPAASDAAADPTPTTSAGDNPWHDPTVVVTTPTSEVDPAGGADPATPGLAGPPSAPAAPAAGAPAGRPLTGVSVEPVVDGQPSAPLRWRPGADRASGRCGAANEAGTSALLVEVVDRASPAPTFGIRLSVSPFPGAGRHPATGTIDAENPATRQVTGTLTVDPGLTSGAFEMRGDTGPPITGRWTCSYGS